MGARTFADYAFDSYGVIVSKEEAERYRQLFFNKYSRLLDWHKDVEITCEMLGGVENRFGRFMSLPDIYSHNKWEKGSAIRRAINSPVQGTASDLLLVAAVEIEQSGIPIVGTIHDSILAEVDEDEAEDACKEIKRIMCRPKALDIFEIEFKIPLEADVAMGSWGSK